MKKGLFVFLFVWLIPIMVSANISVPNFRSINSTQIILDDKYVHNDHVEYNYSCRDNRGIQYAQQYVNKLVSQYSFVLSKSSSSGHWYLTRPTSGIGLVDWNWGTDKRFHIFVEASSDGVDVFTAKGINMN
ncbi:MAG: hypothetical protein IJ563_06795 [Selenomonadaceae bacterium]|nr:hypothetical protein [Selenomonadaceae bacterium]